MRNYPITDAVRAWDYLLLFDSVNKGISRVSLANLAKNTDLQWVQKGDDGKSAYQLAQENGYTGTEEEFADALTASSSPSLFIQATQPADTGAPYIWIQTGLPGGNWSVWFNETGTT